MMNWLSVLHFLLVIITLFTQTLSIFHFRPTPMRYVDYEEQDLFFDRVIVFLLALANYTGNGRKYVLYTSGVLITEDRVLTSYNPFRDTVNSENLMSKTGICYLKTRQIKYPFRTFYTYACELSICGRQVIPMDDKEIAADQWHGPEKKLSPVHDLMVMKLINSVKLWERDESKNYTYESQYTEEARKNNTTFQAGPLLTKLANKDDNIEGPVKFTSLGFKSKIRADRFYTLEVAYYDNYIDVKADCNDWLPRNWGHFICIRNDFLYGFASGALLFFEDTVFGVGSFTMFREKESILVFTDIRPYRDLIDNTCTENDLSIN